MELAEWVCMLMCFKRSPPTPEALKRADIAAETCYCVHLLHEWIQELFFPVFTALQLLVLAACYDGCCPQQCISHGERTLFCRSLHPVFQDEGTDFDQRSMSSERGKLKTLWLAFKPWSWQNTSLQLSEKLWLFLLHLLLSICSRAPWLLVVQ